MKTNVITSLPLVFSLTAFSAQEQKIEFLENDRVKIGVDLKAGGAIMYVEDKALKTGNMINYHDRGRQIQQSYYSGPAVYVGPNGEQPDPAWRTLGWNPIQTGDCAGNASPVLAFTRPDAKTMVIRTAPMLWPHHGVRAECTFTTEIRLTDNGFRYRATIENARTDRTDYGRRAQEIPAVYTNARWFKLVSYLGDSPWSNATSNLTGIVRLNDGKGWPWRTYYTPECWTALVDVHDTGLGVYNPEAYRHTGGFAGRDTNKGRALGPRDSPTGYVAPLRQNVLDANATLSYTALFAVGRLDEIRRTFAAEAQKTSIPTSWSFGKDRLGWSHANAESTGYPLVGNAYSIRLRKNANLQSPDFFLPTSAVQTVTFVASAVRADGQDGTLPVVVELKPFSPSDLIDYPCWSEQGHTVEDYRKKMGKKYPVLKPVAMSAVLKADGAFHTVTLTVPTTAVKAFTRITLRFPGAERGTFSLRSLTL